LARSLLQSQRCRKPNGPRKITEFRVILVQESSLTNEHFGEVRPSCIVEPVDHDFQNFEILDRRERPQIPQTRPDTVDANERPSEVGSIMIVRDIELHRTLEPASRPGIAPVGVEFEGRADLEVDFRIRRVEFRRSVKVLSRRPVAFALSFNPGGKPVSQEFQVIRGIRGTENRFEPREGILVAAGHREFASVRPGRFVKVEHHAHKTASMQSVRGVRNADPGVLR